MSKIARKAMGLKKAQAKAPGISKNVFKTTIAAQGASATPPLGPLLGQFGLNIGNFCKDFNEKTKVYKKGIPLPIVVKVRPDRSYSMDIGTPPISYYLMQAAGITKGRMPVSEDIVGRMTLKHAYEIAQIKLNDPLSEFQIYELEEAVRHVVGIAKGIGIEVSKEYDPEEYGQFIENRNKMLEELRIKLEEEMKLKLLKK